MSLDKIIKEYINLPYYYFYFYENNNNFLCRLNNIIK